MSQPKLALKINVDTLRGARVGLALTGANVDADVMVRVLQQM